MTLVTCSSKFAPTLPALLLVMAVMLAANCAPGVQAIVDDLPLSPVGELSVANFTVLNTLPDCLNATLRAGPGGSAQSAIISPGKKVVFKLELTAPLLTSSILFVYEDVKYAATGSPISRTAAETNTLTANVSSPCDSEQSPGLQCTFTADLGLGVVQTSSECALPTSS